MPTPPKPLLRALGQAFASKAQERADQEWTRASQRDICAHPLFVQFGQVLPT